MHHMERDWEKPHNLLHKKTLNSPVYFFSPRQNSSITQPSNLIGRLLINRILEKHGDWRHMKIPTQENKKLGLPFLFTHQMEKLVLNQAITTQSL